MTLRRLFSYTPAYRPARVVIPL